MKTRIIFSIFFALFIDLTSVLAQTSAKSNTSSVFIHTDRSYYAPGESLFFKAYILDNKTNTNQIMDTLHVALIDYDGIEVANGAFPIENNLYSSSIEIPDIITEGSYMLLASISLRNSSTPENMFSRIVEIREESYLTNLSLTDSIYRPGSGLTAQVKISGAGNPVNFSYQLVGTKGEILTGKGKTTEEGTSIIKIQLPEFDNAEVLKLLVKPDDRNNKKVSGVVIPTKHSEISGKSMGTAREMNKLKIHVSTLKQGYVPGEKVQLSITVTDESGAPLMANLSVSASNLIPFQFPVDYNNLIDYINFKSDQPQISSDWNKSEDILADPQNAFSLFDEAIRNYYAQSLRSNVLASGRTFIVHEKNNIKKLHKKKSAFVAQKGYSSDFSLLDIIMQIKPYHLENGKIIFGISSMNSYYSQDGALIVVDGVKLGSDAGILNTIPVQDIAHISVLTNTMDIQRYTALNSVGVIEITMKKSTEFSGSDQYLSKGNTLYWQPDLMIDKTGTKVVDFLNNDSSGEVLISINGINGRGLYGSTSIRYSIIR